MDSVALSEQLLLTRKSKRLTQAQAAEKIGTTQQTYGRWEKGQKPSAESYAAIAAFLGIEEEDVPRLLYGPHTIAGTARLAPGAREIVEDGDAPEELRALAGIFPDMSREDLELLRSVAKRIRGQE